MNIMTRRSAISFFAIYKVALLTKTEIEDLLFSEYLNEESGEPILYKNIYDDDVQDFLIKLHIEVFFFGVSNEYLKYFLMKCLDCDFMILGEEPKLNKCPCCGYLTLPARGEYDVCPICLWEDDGRSEENIDSYSSVNHLSLKDYRLSKMPNLINSDIIYNKG